MTILLIIKIAAVGILISIVNQILKQSGKDDMAYFTSLSGIILVLLWILPYLAELFEIIKKMFEL
ncbi:MAG TPA: stage III sporulation protein AC [Clostridiales bacterium]|nr:stage III sporulation protein AC [Clostridiales bacterium]